MRNPAAESFVRAAVLPFADATLQRSVVALQLNAAAASPVAASQPEWALGTLLGRCVTSQAIAQRSLRD